MMGLTRKGTEYSSLHKWIRHRLPKPELCQNCKLNPPRDLANISQEYKLDLKDWEYLCRKCHLIKDGRINNLKLGQKVRWSKLPLSGIRGVYWNTHINKWIAQIKIENNSKNIYLGAYSNIQAAWLARRWGERSYKRGGV